MKLSPAILFILLFALALSGCNGCFQNTNVVKPKAVTDSITIDLPLSTFNVPVRYNLQNFEDWINQVIKGKFLETVINPLNDKREPDLAFLNGAVTSVAPFLGKDVLLIDGFK
mgnify:CR=1 FL=1